MLASLLISVSAWLSGLSIAFDSVREHAGALEVSSPPGKGACFKIRLPIATGGAA
jgi:signal transduction histidine kinase